MVDPETHEPVMTWEDVQIGTPAEGAVLDLMGFYAEIM